jgi:hypothetical protein
MGRNRPIKFPPSGNRDFVCDATLDHIRSDIGEDRQHTVLPVHQY